MEMHAEARRGTESCGAKIRVLLADDHPAILQQVARILDQNQEPAFQVVGTAQEGSALLDMAQGMPADVVVLDITMPCLSGLEVARRLRASLTNLRVVFLTVHDEPDFAEEAFASGALGYVIKSRLAQDLCPAIGEALAGRPFVSPTPSLMQVRAMHGLPQ